MGKMCWMLWLAVALGTQTAKAMDTCRTIEVCETPGERSCTGAARSAGGLNFYWRLPLQPRHGYHCEMDSSRTSHVQVLPHESTTPSGVLLTWDACCAFAPAVVNIDTYHMEQPQGDAIIKFQVGPSDIPSDVRIVCRFDDKV